MKYLNEGGLSYLWGKIKSNFATKSEISALIERLEALEANKATNIILLNQQISYTPTENATYELYYADENGIALADYDVICTFDAISGETSSYSDFNSLNVAPVEAKKIIAVNQSTGETVDQVFINTALSVSNKDLGAKLYSFGLLSDTHVDGDGDDASSSVVDFQKELEFFNSKNVDFIGITGDLTYDGRVEDFQAYQNIVSQYASGKTIFACRGNHDTYTDISNWNTYVDTNGLNYEWEYNGDKFLILGLSSEDFSGNFITDEQMTWLITKLNAYRNQRCFLLFHVFVEPVRKCK